MATKLAAKQQSSQLFLPVWSIHLAEVEDVSRSEKKRKYQKHRPRKSLQTALPPEDERLKSTSKRGSIDVQRGTWLIQAARSPRERRMMDRRRENEQEVNVSRERIR